MPNDERDSAGETIQRLLQNVRGLNTTLLVSAIVGAANRPHSIAEVLDLRRDIENILKPRPKDKAYVEWAKTQDDRLNRVRK
jgi:hypothetical protein